MINAKSRMSVCLQLGIVLFTAALAGSAPATARGTSGHDAGVAVPFKGDVEGVETYDLSNFPTMLVDTTAGGVATHLGRYTVTWEFTVDLTTGAGSGSAHYVAANGDSLYTTVVGQGDPSGIPGVNQVVETHTITGGTGRFAGASGSFTQVRLAAPTETFGWFEGTIVLAKGK